MTEDRRQALQQVLDFCNAKWTDADKSISGVSPAPDILIGQKQAYNEVFQFVRTLVREATDG
jgi:hypothetical protein